MTNQPPADARASAWIGAHERIEAAQKLKLDEKRRVRDPLPELYWATIAEAAVLADLARTNQTTGLHAGGYLVEQHDRRLERVRLREDVRAKLRANAINDAADDADLGDHHGDHPEARCSDCGTPNAGPTCQPAVTTHDHTIGADQ